MEGTCHNGHIWHRYYLLPQGSLFRTFAGALMGVGLAFLLKFIPFKWSEFQF